jgi:hypothetical protein
LDDINVFDRQNVVEMRQRAGAVEVIDAVVEKRRLFFQRRPDVLAEHVGADHADEIALDCGELAVRPERHPADAAGLGGAAAGFVERVVDRRVEFSDFAHRAPNLLGLVVEIHAEPFAVPQRAERVAVGMQVADADQIPAAGVRGHPPQEFEVPLPGRVGRVEADGEVVPVFDDRVHPVRVGRRGREFQRRAEIRGELVGTEIAAAMRHRLGREERVLQPAVQPAELFVPLAGQGARVHVVGRVFLPRQRLGRVARHGGDDERAFPFLARPEMPPRGFGFLEIRFVAQIHGAFRQ